MSMKLMKIYIGRILTSIFHVFPIKKNRIAFCSYAGRDITCNPYYFNKYLISRCTLDKWEYIWFVNEPDKVNIPSELEGKIKLVKTKSAAYFFYVLTSRFVIYNLGLPLGSLIVKRKKQTWVFTWHGGGAFKKAGQDVFHDKIKKKIDVLSGKQVDIFLSTNKVFSKVIPNAVCVAPEKFMEIGMPRNDIMFGDKTYFYDKVRKAFDLSKETKLVLYAPTYRGDFQEAQGVQSLDYDVLKSALSKKFGGHWEVLERSHYAVKNADMDKAINASAYPDMQELLMAVDVLITDYSSSIWDYAFTGKPGFLYTPDLEEYRKKVDFYTEIETWPFVYAESMNSLVDAIYNYDSDIALQKIDKYFQLVGNCEDGTAAQRLADCLNIQ